MSSDRVSCFFSIMDDQLLVEVSVRDVITSPLHCLKYNGTEISRFCQALLLEVPAIRQKVDTSSFLKRFSINIFAGLVEIT